MSDGPADPRIAEIHHALESGRIAAASAGARQLLQDAETDELRLKAHALAGMCCFHLGEYAPAATHFAATAEGLPSRPAWFRVALARTLSGAADAGAEAFAKAVAADGEDAVSRELTVPFMRFDYAGALLSAGELDRALVQLSRIERLYPSLPSTEDAVVLQAGVPALSHFVNLLLEVFERRGSKTEAKRWARQFARTIDDHGRKVVTEVGARRLALRDVKRGGPAR